MNLRFVVLPLLLASALGGCVEKSRTLSAAEREQLSRFVSQQAPSPQHPLEISFENKLELIGYDVSAESWAPGATLTVTWHWKVLRSLEDGWLAFTHVADGTTNRLNEDSTGTVRQLYPPGQWKVGEYIRDEQQITLPADWSASEATFYLGFWNGPHRLRVIRGPNDGDNRARPLSIPTRAGGGGEVRANPTQGDDLPSLMARRAESITIDGRLDEPSWAATPSTGRFVNTMSGGPAEFRAEAKVLWDDEWLYVGFEVEDDFLKSPFRSRDDHLWEADAVEIMIDPDGDGRNYFELQVSPRNQIFDTRYDSRRVPQPIGHADWNADIRSAVAVRGTIDDTRADEGYTVEVAIRWSSFATGTPPATKPSAGDTWRMNFYVMDARQRGQRASGWSPPRVGDFHVPDRFGRVTFVAPTARALERTEEVMRALGALQADLAAEERAAPAAAPPVPTPRPLVQIRPEAAAALQGIERRRDVDQRQGNEPIEGAPR